MGFVRFRPARVRANGRTDEPIPRCEGLFLQTSFLLPPDTLLDSDSSDEGSESSSESETVCECLRVRSNRRERHMGPLAALVWPSFCSWAIACCSWAFVIIFCNWTTSAVVPQRDPDTGRIPSTNSYGLARRLYMNTSHTAAWADLWETNKTIHGPFLLIMLAGPGAPGTLLEDRERARFDK